MDTNPSILLSVLLFSCFLVTPTLSSNSIWPKTPRLTPHHPRSYRAPTTTSSPWSAFYFYKQTLDHFNYRPDSYITFNQRYTIDFRYWGGANTSAPIFVNLGDEAPIEYDMKINFLHEHAPTLKALVVFIEHRYYGKSVPFGSKEEAFRNSSTLGYFNSAQALADYAEVILHIKQKLSAQSSPVIVFGGSYGGMLASWFRLKYPHIAHGALASSAPILYFEDIVPHDGYYAIVSKDFRDVSENCHNTIRSSWSIIDRIASKPHGLSYLSQKFQFCSPLNSSSDLKDYLNYMYAEAAQYNRGPDFSVNDICDAIDGATSNGSDVLSSIYAGVAAHMGESICHGLIEFSDPNVKLDGWKWQTCTDLIIPMDHGANATMFQFSTYDPRPDFANCQKWFGVSPRPHWIATEFGGRDIKLVLQNFGSNIIFSNGLRDPYSAGGVLQNISDSIVALTTSDGSHCMDLSGTSSDDPGWLVDQRAAEIEIIKGWIMDYNIMHGIKSVI